MSLLTILEYREQTKVEQANLAYFGAAVAPLTIT
jgi:hypothetical protein